MSRYCRVLGCKSDIWNSQLHRFPKILETAELWRKFCRNPALKNVPVNKLHLTCLICEKHFKTSQYQTPERIKLNRNVVPTLHRPPALRVSRRKNPSKSFSDRSKLKKTSSKSQPSKAITPNLDYMSVNKSHVSSNERNELSDDSLSQASMDDDDDDVVIKDPFVLPYIYFGRLPH